MPLVEAPLGDLRLEKSIVIDSRTAKEYEAKGQILQSDEYVDRDRGENLAPGQFMQEVVDANTAAKLAAAKGITLAGSVDEAAGIYPNRGNVDTTVGGGRQSKMPLAILESFRKQPPIAPTTSATTPAFDPEFIAGVQEANRRLNKAGGDRAPRIPQNAAKLTLNEEYGPNPTYAPHRPEYNTPQQMYSGVPQASVDYSVMAALMKDAVREVLKETNLKDIVKAVLKEERETLTKQAINENIEIKIGNSIFSGKISNMKSPKK